MDAAPDPDQNPRRSTPVLPEPPQPGRHAGFLWRWSPPRLTSNAQADSSSQVSSEIDTATGADEAIRRADALSEAVAGRTRLLYGGGDSLDIGAIMAAESQIRNLRNYIQAIGAAGELQPHPFAIPLARLKGVQASDRSGASLDSNATTGGWDAYQ